MRRPCWAADGVFRPARGLRLPPNPLGQNLPPTGSPALTPPEESAETTHRHPRLSRLRPTASCDFRLCSGRVQPQRSEARLGQSLLGAPRRHHQLEPTRPLLPRDPSHRGAPPHTPLGPLKAAALLGAIKKAAAPPPQNTVFVFLRLCRVVHHTAWRQWKSSPGP